jgi:hypothetical protein
VKTDLGTRNYLGHNQEQTEVFLELFFLNIGYNHHAVTSTLDLAKSKESKHRL